MAAVKKKRDRPENYRISRSSCLVTLGLNPFTEDPPDPELIILAHLYSVGRCLALECSSQLNEIICFISETYMPGLKLSVQHKVLKPPRARERLMVATNALFRSKKALEAVSTATIEDWNVALQGPLRSFAGFQWPWSCKKTDPCTPEMCVSALRWLAGFSKSSAVLLSVTRLTYICAALIKKGIVSPALVKKLESNLLVAVGTKVTFHPYIATAVYETFHGCVDEDNMQACILRCHDLLPTLPLKMCFNRLQGLTTITTIVKAVMRHPDFNWGSISALLPGQVANATVALRDIDDNPYYGLAGELGRARSSRYRDLGYVAKELCVQLDCQTSLNKYAGWPENPRNEVALNRIIDNYKRRLKSTGHTEETPPANPFDDQWVVDLKTEVAKCKRLATESGIMENRNSDRSK